MSFLNGLAAFGAGLNTFAGNALKDEIDRVPLRKPLLNSTPSVAVESTPIYDDDGRDAAAPISGSIGGGKGGVALGMRQNNPGNLAYAGQEGASVGKGNRFAVFPDMPSGVAATAEQLALYQTKHGINTVQDAVERWVKDPTANLKNYISHVAAAIGVAPDAKIDLTNPQVQAAFILAQQPHESGGGGAVLNPADVIKGVQMAAARRGRFGVAQSNALLDAGAT